MVWAGRSAEELKSGYPVVERKTKPDERAGVPPSENTPPRQRPMSAYELLRQTFFPVRRIK